MAPNTFLQAVASSKLKTKVAKKGKAKKGKAKKTYKKKKRYNYASEKDLIACSCGTKVQRTYISKHRKTIQCVLWHLDEDRREGDALDEVSSPVDKVSASSSADDSDRLASEAIRVVLGHLRKQTTSAFEKVAFDVGLADKIVDRVFCGGFGYSRAEITRFGRGSNFSFKKPISQLLEAVFVSGAASDLVLSDAYYEWARETVLFKASVMKDNVEDGKKDLKRYLKRIPSNVKTVTDGGNFKTNVRLGATLQFYIADTRRRVLAVFAGITLDEVDEWLAAISEIGDRDGWNGVITGRILLRALPSDWDHERLASKGGTKNADFKRQFNSQVLPTLRDYAVRAMAERKGPETAGKKSVDFDAGIARAAEVKGVSEEEIEAMIKSSDELPLEVVDALGVEIVADPARRRKGPKAIRHEYRLYLSTFDVVEEGANVVGSEWTRDMLTDFVRGLKVVTPGQQPPKSITPVEAELLVTKVPSMAHRTHRALMRVLDRRSDLIRAIWDAESVDEDHDDAAGAEHDVFGVGVGVGADEAVRPDPDPQQVVTDAAPADLVSDDEDDVAHHHGHNSVSSGAPSSSAPIKKRTRDVSSDDEDDDDSLVQDVPKQSAAKVSSGSGVKMSHKSAHKSPSKKRSKSSKSLREAGSKRDQTKLDAWLRH